MSKDKLYGFGLVIIFLVGLLLYTTVVLLPLLQYALEGPVWKNGYLASILPISMPVALFWLMVPVFLGVLLFSIIVIWIGWTMATTPPPEPIDLDSLDLEEEEEGKDNKEKEEKTQSS